jgi:hypothetical protein
MPGGDERANLTVEDARIIMTMHHRDDEDVQLRPNFAHKRHRIGSHHWPSGAANFSL